MQRTDRLLRYHDNTAISISYMNYLDNEPLRVNEALEICRLTVRHFAHLPKEITTQGDHLYNEWKTREV